MVGRYPDVVNKEEAALAARMGVWIRERRDALGWSQATLAERIDTSIEYVSMLERGARLRSLPSLVALARALTLSLASLVAVHAVGRDDADVLAAAARAVLDRLRPLIARMLAAIVDVDPAVAGAGRGGRRR
ncbi:MAG: helix-turn-helix transcriptional regulator [Deltaproteobacteria bacterium]|nr:helix-turn-helix transcriptional regulator [Deltaproteobacteria bacterium]